MSEDVKQAKDDIAYIRSILKDGARAPLVIGYIYVVEGIVFGLQALRQYTLDLGWSLPPVLTQRTPWDLLFLLLAGFGISAIVMWRRRENAADTFSPHNKSPATLAALSAWGVITFAVALGVVSLWLSGIEGMWIAALILFSVAWGAGWSITYAVHRVRWHNVVAWGFFAEALAIGTAADSTSLPLVVSAGLFLLFALPGYLIIRAARAEE